MNRPVIVSILLISGISYAAEKSNVLPKDVSAFIEKRDMCDHFRGEEPYDKERRAFLEKNILELCTGSDAALANLKSKYINDKEVSSRLDKYESKIEATSYK